MRDLKQYTHKTFSAFWGYKSIVGHSPKSFIRGLKFSVSQSLGNENLLQAYCPVSPSIFAKMWKYAGCEPRVLALKRRTGTITMPHTWEKQGQPGSKPESGRDTS